MSTPISAIPDDVDMPQIDDEDFFDAEPEPRYTPPTRHRSAGKSLASGGSSYLVKYKSYGAIFVAAVVALKIPMDAIRQQAPAQLFSFGDAPVRALLVVAVYVIMLQLVKTLMQ